MSKNPPEAVVGDVGSELVGLHTPVSVRVQENASFFPKIPFAITAPSSLTSLINAGV